jgi:hypothetical protein
MRIKPYIQLFFTLTLSVLLLLASSGLSLNKMVCLFTGNTFISLQPIPECMPKDLNTTQFHAKCCDFSQVTMDLEFDAERNQQQLVDQAIPAALVLDHYVLSFKPMLDAHYFDYTDLPPPLPLGRSLALRQTYLI